MISHELRTPLNAILGFAGMMRQQIFGPVGNPQYQDYMENIYQSGELFLSLAEARYIVDRWRLDYNHHRPHSRLDWMTPAAYAASCPRLGRPCVPTGSATPHPPEHTENVLV